MPQRTLVLMPACRAICRCPHGQRRNVVVPSDVDAEHLAVGEVVIVADDGFEKSGPVPVLFRSGAHVKRPSVRRPRVISSRGLSVFCAGCRIR